MPHRHKHEQIIQKAAQMNNNTNMQNSQDTEFDLELHNIYTINVCMMLVYTFFSCLIFRHINAIHFAHTPNEADCVVYTYSSH